MLLRISMKGRLAAALAAALIGAATAAWATPAEDLRDAQKLYSQGKYQPALDKVDAFLKAEPRDPQGRFLKGLVLTEEKRTNEAIQVFSGLTEDFPELPEPYNNLAVLYASQGNYDKAKSALELAIHTHPSYATAHENLGDIYAQLASRAYDRALQLDKNNTTAQVKLAMVKKLFSSQAITAASKGAAAEEPKAEAPKVVAPKVEPAPAATAKAVENPKTEPMKVAKLEPRKPAKAEPRKAEPKKVEPKKVEPAPAQPASAATPETKSQLTAAVEAWASAWSAQDVKGYLAHYAPDFEVPAGLSREAWEKQRKERLEHPKSIEVEVKFLSEHVDGDAATVTFRQSYRSDTFKSNSTKTLKLERSGGQWLIKYERVDG